MSCLDPRNTRIQITYLGTSGPRNTRIPLHATVAMACNSAGWILASLRSDEALNLHAYLTTITMPNRDLPRDS
ncbi:unnamed protein product [Arabis nemorensis]|uniref:Uncharacterized protein n=1 Tax=Arabis nemorensis TaxID=586526 RepID=A0A565CGP0_9BRAS|nr:unnamed protein product [Arabis nemorensis]